MKIATENRETENLDRGSYRARTGACNVQVIGKTLVLYRPTNIKYAATLHYPKVTHICCVKRGGFPQAGEQNATLCSLIKGRIAAFSLSLQYINILSMGNSYRYSTLILQILLRRRRFDDHNIIFFFANRATSNRQITGVGLFKVRLRHRQRCDKSVLRRNAIQHRYGSTKITRPLLGILVTSITCAFDSLASMSLIRPSQETLCSRAAWYSAFSFRSPCSRASAIAAMIFRTAHGFQEIQLLA